MLASGLVALGCVAIDPEVLIAAVIAFAMASAVYAIGRFGHWWYYG